MSTGVGYESEGGASGEDLKALEALESRQVFGAGYLMLEKIGVGGFGHVWLAQRPPDQLHAAASTGSRGLCALKITTPPHKRRLIEEVANLRGLAGVPRIVELFDADLDAPFPYFAMPYLTGQSLDELTGQLYFFELAWVLQQVGTTLDAVHRRGYVHRDVSAKNIQFDEHNGEDAVGKVGHVYLIDYGIAYKDEQERRIARITHSHTCVGATAYMAPEARTSDLPGPACDVFSLAVVAVEQLRGARMRPKEYGEALGERELEQCRVKMPDGNDSPLPRALRATLLRALSANPSKRPSPMEFVRPFQDVARERWPQSSAPQLTGPTSVKAAGEVGPAPTDAGDQTGQAVTVSTLWGRGRVPRGRVPVLALTLAVAFGSLSLWLVRGPAESESGSATQAASVAPVTPPTTAEVKQALAAPVGSRTDRRAQPRASRESGPIARTVVGPEPARAAAKPVLISESIGARAATAVRHLADGEGLAPRAPPASSTSAPTAGEEKKVMSVRPATTGRARDDSKARAASADTSARKQRAQAARKTRPPPTAGFEGNETKTRSRPTVPAVERKREHWF